MTVVDPSDVAGSVLRAGGSRRDVVEAEAFALFLAREAAAERGDPITREEREAWRPYINGTLSSALELDWRAILGWKGEDA